MKKIILIGILFLYFSGVVHADSVSQQKVISLNFQEVDIKSVFQVLAEVSHVNMIVSDQVQGKITLHLENIPWQKALDIILQSYGLGKKEINGVILIAPITEIASREKQQLEAEEQLQELGPLESELIQINYGVAADLAKLLKDQDSSLLSSRGNVRVDTRTNTLWIQDIPEHVKEIHQLINQLDIPVRQVLIEARIVTMDSDFAKELGVRFGVTQGSHVSGTLEGANLLSNVHSAGSVPLSQRLNVDLPSTGVGTADGASSLGLALTKLGAGTLLDLELSAMESEGEGQIISNPRLITADQQPAIIQAGEEIPYQESAASGATSVTFKNAVLSLSVTPQITPGSKLMLTLKVNQDRPSNKISVRGVPAIDTRSIQTRVLVDNGETIVLGGIYEMVDKNQVKRVPFLSDLPLVGKWFQHKHESFQRRELLIFVTPRILDSPLP